MRKYWLVAKNTWDETLTYRLNFVMWRFRVVLSILTIYFFWLAALPKNGSIFGYPQSLMLTYILVSSLIYSTVISSRSTEIGTQINNGDLSNFLIKPINYFSYWFSRDLGDKAMNIAFSITELTILLLILKPPFIVQTNITYLGLFSIAIFVSLFMYFFINILIGSLGFWSPEVWAPRFIFFIVLNFFAGIWFPLDILPKPIYSALQLLPFPYLLYFPSKIYLGQLSYFEIYRGIFISAVWALILYVVIKFVWNKGLKSYTAQGR